MLVYLIASKGQFKRTLFFTVYQYKEIIWCRLPGSNWRPTDYKSVALPTELSRRVLESVSILANILNIATIIFIFLVY